ncbi:pantoate--beta-alanine ligase [Domibacillus robiginosus]|uniref:pantoate--beta-alanine ligase n=1 Tax=Domibacillus robiginosus TaxID=1071054 RepID=UPI00067D5391|nr:pantoate--beta-alanine ligase [Domibacillus robiginosus]
MKIVRTISALKQEIRAAQTAGQSIGFVPTMGFLHEGHLTLARQARRENDCVVMSIFVNPLQFGPNEDFERYPRDEERDTLLAGEAGVDLLFLPSVEEMYPEEPAVTLTVQKRTNALCGLSREGHFDGVATVVMKLFHLTEADRAYFGKKDAQQLAVIHGLVDALNVPIEIIGVNTVREPDGLAKSSRNVYLLPEEREKAPAIYQALGLIQRSVEAGETNVASLKEKARLVLEEQAGASIDYLEILSYPALEPVEEVDATVIAAAAVQYKQARLIDNVILSMKGSASCTAQ